MAAALVAAICDALGRGGAAPEAPGGARFGIQAFSEAFLNEYWLYFELVSVLLVAAVVAALAVLEVGRRQRG